MILLPRFNQRLLSDMDPVSSQLFRLAGGGPEQPVHGSSDVIFSDFQLRLFLNLVVPLSHTYELCAQVCGIAFPIGCHVGRTMAILTGYDGYAQGRGFEHRSSDAVARWSADISKASGQQRQELVVAEVPQQE